MKSDVTEMWMQWLFGALLLIAVSPLKFSV